MNRAARQHSAGESPESIANLLARPAYNIPIAMRGPEEIPSRLEAFPGAIDLVRDCREAGLSVAVASSADLIKVSANLKKIGLPLQFWDAVVTGEDVLHKKPAPDIFLSAARKLGVTPPECVVVEDAVNGVQAAHAAGMRCVATATTFPSNRLQEADVARNRIKDVLLSDLAPHLHNG